MTSVTTDVVLVRLLAARAKEVWENVLSHSATLNINELFKEHLALRESLQEICALQKAFDTNGGGSNTMEPVEREKALGEFRQWVERMGIDHGDVDIAYISEMNQFGLQAVNRVFIGSDLLQVPRKAILSWDLARRSSLLKRAFERDLIIRSMENVALAMMLCCQKLLPDSSWQPYINILPVDFNTPLYFSIEELQNLRPSPVFEESLLLYRNVARQFVHFLLSVLNSDDYRASKKSIKRTTEEEPIFLNTPLTAANFTFDLYRWSVACITTRVNLIPSQIANDVTGQPSMIPSLIPLLDMANHKHTTDAFHEAVHFSEESNCAEIVAVRNYEPGEAITIFYGWRSNREFMLHNGFVPLETNTRDIYKLKLGLPKNKRDEARLNAIRAIGFQIESSVFAFEIKFYEPHFHSSLIQFARIYVLDQFPTGENVDAVLNSDENATKAWCFLRDRFALLRRAYGDVVDPSTATNNNLCPPSESNENSLDDHSKDLERKSMVARLKLSEMDILKKAEIYCKKQVLQSSWSFTNIS